MLDHLEKCIFNIIKMHQWLDKYSEICLYMRDDYNLTSQNKSYEDVCQWNGEELKKMSRYLLGVVLSTTTLVPVRNTQVGSNSPDRT